MVRAFIYKWKKLGTVVIRTIIQNTPGCPKKKKLQSGLVKDLNVIEIIRRNLNHAVMLGY